jgi:hypothetical protein
MVYSSANLSFERVGEGPAPNAAPKGRRVTTSQDVRPGRDFLLKRACRFLFCFVSEKHYSCYGRF